jgi:hypothetical protein
MRKSKSFHFREIPKCVCQQVNVRPCISDTHACGSLTRPIGEGTDIRVTSQAHMTEIFHAVSLFVQRKQDVGQQASKK